MEKAVRFPLILIALAFSLVILAGCAKDEEKPGEYFMRFKANGEWVEYTNQLGLTAGFAQSGVQHVGTITGWNDATSNHSLLLYDKTPVAEGTYSGYETSVDGVVGVIFAHKDKESQAVFGTDLTKELTSRVTISEKSETAVRGTFSGVVSSAGHPDIEITEGTFHVKKVLDY